MQSCSVLLVVINTVRPSYLCGVKHPHFVQPLLGCHGTSKVAPSSSNQRATQSTAITSCFLGYEQKGICAGSGFAHNIMMANFLTTCPFPRQWQMSQKKKNSTRISQLHFMAQKEKKNSTTAGPLQLLLDGWFSFL